MCGTVGETQLWGRILGRRVLPFANERAAVVPGQVDTEEQKIALVGWLLVSRLGLVVCCVLESVGDGSGGHGLVGGRKAAGAVEIDRVQQTWVEQAVEQESA